MNLQMKNLCHVVVLAISPLMIVACATSSSNLGEKLTCDQHAEVATTLNEWAARNFDKTYGGDKNPENAYAQLFLIEQKAPSNFATAFNQYEAKSIENRKFATAKSCDTSGYPASPIQEFKNKMKTLNR
ncbi:MULTISPECIES: hypothetical protein [unclassified Herbaspirillum]|jgi:hypothetical protein|uniref:hypothetical protein n=1 Tax=unclassified Herbaspirillum TaxID=2624150 RepID=UPI0010728392|nr:MULTISPECIES: hypothetical protein [unclassified Herbaspirillum]TFI08872.1 hypothetical protein E4P32_12140 [Herbaspirillum sp. 3R11]TFI15289.1 hypothetical protein E4P31_12140 [Herbaspirillum sp. 3R-11]TFI27834.1 hypothetical protein E4P30_09110 [Herbaspirillum sp. 3C11]